MSYTELKSHKNKKLEDHLENVANISKKSFIYLNIENNELFSDISFLIGLAHDFAKSTSFFQNYLQNGGNKENTPHSLLSSIFAFYIVNKYLEKNNIEFEIDLASLAYIVILRHHGNLKNVSEESPTKKSRDKMLKLQLDDLMNSDLNLNKFYKKYDINLDDFYKNFNDIISEIEMNLLCNFEMEPNSNNYLLFLLFFSVLIDADKMDAAEINEIERLNIDGNIVDKYKAGKLNKFSSIKNIRDKAYNEVINKINNVDIENNRILSINLPTGIGKTLIGVSVALKLKEQINKKLNFNPRFIYSLPFLSVIDQNENVISDILEYSNLESTDYLLKHHSLSDMSYKKNFDEENFDISNNKLLIEGWNSEIIITTFVQFFLTLFSNTNKSVRRFHNLTNSIIILDEIQSIPYKYWGVIKYLLEKLANDYNCWIIFMTATQPLIFKENEVCSLVDNVDEYFKLFDRVDFSFDLENKDFEIFKADIFDEIYGSSKDYMVILNTIKSVDELYEYIKESYELKGFEVKIDENGICNIEESIELICLTTKIIPKHRFERIDNIKNSNKRKIIITTQLVEAGVDIDVDVIYRDLAPLDSIIQSAGRCNRNNNKEKGKINVISLHDGRKNTASYIYDSLLLNLTKEILKEFSSNVSEKDFNLEASKKYFQLLSKRSNNDKNLKDCIKYLQFEEVNRKFNLIENNLPKVDVFVELDEEATKILKKFESILKNYRGYERKNQFFKIKSKFYNYVVPIDENKIGATNFIENTNTFLIGHDDLDRKYSLETGFLTINDENPFII